jgi:hypothetical protein
MWCIVVLWTTLPLDQCKNLLNCKGHMGYCLNSLPFPFALEKAFLSFSYLTLELSVSGGVVHANR